ncbi:MAG: 2-amino-4-hydroxy-6-hydroxymethyldihydropteridine diphosphokinase [Acidobacteria bacterium]|nr:2-amino-4-hydroxy-6-hydroxymethyldihydropteridine diphosphokinase [Acidobacteriota bacterium]
MKVAYLALGSNVGDRAGQIEHALRLMSEAGVLVCRRSALYETEPVGMSAQRWFLNCVVEVETELMPLALLRALKSIERRLGRRAAGPQPIARRIDIDIIVYGQQVVRLPELTIPHPRLAERRFVLEPLRELAPDWRHPVTRLTPGEMLAQLNPAQKNSGLRRWPRREPAP